MQLLLERAALLEMMVRQEAISSGKFTGYPHGFLQVIFFPNCLIVSICEFGGACIACWPLL